MGDPFPEETYQICKEADAVLFSAVGDPKFDNNPTAKVRPEQGLLAMRKRLGLFANIRPVQTFKCLLHKSPLRAELVEGADFLCIRELTGGMYFGEKYQDNDKAYDTNMYTRSEIERILRVGFEYAMKRRKHLTVVDKANVLAYILRETLKKDCASATKLIVAQRIGTIRDADQIIVLEEGKIAGMGTHEELMQTCTVYQQIAYSQLSKEELA